MIKLSLYGRLASDVKEIKTKSRKAFDEQGKPLLALEVLPRFSEIDKTGALDKEAFVTDKIKEINCTLPTYMQINRILLRKTDFERTPDMKIKRYGKSSAGV